MSTMQYYTNPAKRRKIDFLLAECASLFANCDSTYAARQQAKYKEQDLLAQIAKLDYHFAIQCGYQQADWPPTQSPSARCRALMHFMHLSIGQSEPKPKRSIAVRCCNNCNNLTSTSFTTSTSRAESTTATTWTIAWWLSSSPLMRSSNGEAWKMIAPST